MKKCQIGPKEQEQAIYQKGKHTCSSSSREWKNSSISRKNDTQNNR